MTATHLNNELKIALCSWSVFINLYLEPGLLYFTGSNVLLMKEENIQNI